MGIFDAVQKPGEELPDEELQKKADEFDRVQSYHEHHAKQKAEQNNNS